MDTHPVHVLFADLTRLHGERPAIISAGRTRTFAELRHEANRIAGAVLAHRPVAGAPVAVATDDAAAFVACALGVVATGRPYVALDRSLPVARIREILADAGPPIVLSDDPKADSARFEGWPAQWIDVRALATAEAGVSDVDGDVAVSPCADACLIYTSGSTGRPKGVVHSHRSLIHAATVMGQALGIRPDDRVALLHATSAPAARTTIYGSLFRGAALYPFDVRREGAGAVADWMRRERITVCHMIPSLFRAVMTAVPPDAVLSDVRVVKLGGETATRDDAALYRRHFPTTCRLVNGLGITEVATNACLFVIDHETPLGDAVLPVGYPTPDTEIEIVDDAGSPVGPGETGQIVVRSRYLASGYWRDPELTARAFQPSRQAGGPGTFRTGDLARRAPDGCITHLGRTDGQIKVRGYRVELAEIETAVREIEGIDRAVALARRGPSGEARIDVFFVPLDPAMPSPTTVQAALARRLPDFMRPSACHALPAMPLLPGGKVDRAALERLADDARARRSVEPVQSGDLVQLQLKQIWESVLQTTDIGNGDDFFELGGHSLAAAEVCSLIERVMGVRLPLMALADAPTIEALGRAIRGQGWREAWSPIVVLRRGGARPPLFCMAGAGSDVFALRDLVRHLGDDQPVYGLQPRGLDGVTPFHRTVEEAAAWCLTAMRRIQPRGPYNLCGSSFGGKVVFDIARQLQDQGERVAVLALLDTYGPGYPKRVPHPTPRARIIAATRPFLPPNLFVLTADLYLRGELTRPWIRELRRMTRRYWRAWWHVALPARRGGRPFDLRFECLQAASFRASRRYSPPPIEGRIDLFSSAPAPAPGLLADDATLGWEGLASEGVCVHAIPGRHADQLREPAVRAIAAALGERLASR